MSSANIYDATVGGSYHGVPDRAIASARRAALAEMEHGADHRHSFRSHNLVKTPLCIWDLSWPIWEQPWDEDAASPRHVYINLLCPRLGYILSHHHQQPSNSSKTNIQTITTKLLINSLSAPHLKHTLSLSPTQAPNSTTSTIAMAAMTSTSFTTSCPVVYGRSGYNKDGNGDDDEDNKLVNYGRSGYNK